MTDSVPISIVPVGLDVDPDTAHYIGVLEGTIAALVINETKYRAYLELLTGEPWEDTRIDVNGNMLVELAVSALVNQTGMDRVKAQTLVWRRWEERNLPQEAVVPIAVPTESLIDRSANPRDMSERLKAWRLAQQFAANEIHEEESTNTNS